MHGVPPPAMFGFGLLGAEVKLPHAAAQGFIRLSPSWIRSKEACGLLGTFIISTDCRPKAMDKARVKPGCRIATTRQWADFFQLSISKRMWPGTPLSHEQNYNQLSSSANSICES
jgi:hypothetical protein